MDQELIPRLKEEDLNVYTSFDLMKKIGTSAAVLESTVFGQKVVSDRRLLGYNVKDFHKRLKAGELLPKTPFQQFERSGTQNSTYDTYYKLPDGRTQRIYPRNTGDYFYAGTDWILTEEMLYPHIPIFDRRLPQAAAAEINSLSYDGLTFLAELGSTKEMFFNLANRLYNLKLPKRLQNAKEMANDWMEGRYGWRTLLMDLEDLNELVKSLDNERKKRFSKKVKDSSKTTEVSSYVTNHFLGTRTWKTTDMITVSEIGAVTADVEMPRIAFNPMMTAWELVPYSFVIDWMLSVGQALAAATFLILQKQYVASWGYRVEIERSFTSSVTKWAVNNWGENNINCLCKATLEYRQPCGISVKPALDLKMNVAKVIDALAMLIQKRKS